MPFYEYDKRNEELQRILRIKYDGVKEKALKRFIQVERSILLNLQISLGTTFILNSASTHLATLQMQEEEPDIRLDFH